MRYTVMIEWEPDRWFPLGAYTTRQDAEWAIAMWRQKTGHLPQSGDRGFKVVATPS